MTLRPIDISGIEPLAAPPPPSPNPQLAWVPIEKLFIDDTYQRELGQKNLRIVRRIAESFDWSLFTPITVAPVEGEDAFTLIDGQHRAHAAALAGLHLVPAAIVDIPRARQAAAFAGINAQRTAVSSLNLFKAALAAREPWAIEAAEAVAKAGCRLMTANKSTKAKRPREVFVVGLIRDHVVAGRAEVVTAGLRALSESSCGDRVDLYAQRTLRPWIGALAQDGQLLSLDITRFVSTIDLADLIDRAASARAQGDTRSAYQIAMSDIRDALGAFARRDKAALARICKVRTRMAVPKNQKKTTGPTSLPESAARWSPDRDERLRETGGRYRLLSALAEEWGLSIKVVQARWHLVRRAV